MRSYLFAKHGTRAKAVLLSLVTKEGRMAWSFVCEVFDIAGDYGMFMGIQAAYGDTAENRAKATPVYIPAMVAVIVCTLISVAALGIRIVLLFKQMRRRRHELRGVRQRRAYALLLDAKIEEAEGQCTQVYIGIALACCEDLPMGFIGLYFLSTTYSIPPFIIVSLFTSALLLGMKIAAVTTLPYWFGKLKKWKANRPAGAVAELLTHSTEAHQSGMAGRQAASGAKLTGTVSTTANDAFVALMKTIRSDIVKALQFVDQQPPMPAEVDATANAVAWLRKNKDQLLCVIHNLATPESEAAPVAVKTLTSVIHAHPLPRPLEDVPLA